MQLNPNGGAPGTLPGVGFASRLRSVPALLGLLALGWVGLIVASGDGAEMMLTAPFLVAGALLLGLLIVEAARGNARALYWLLVLILIFPNISFRRRGIANIGLDWQNAAKILIWLAILFVVAVHWRRIVPLFKHPLIVLPTLYASFAMLSAAWSEVPAYTFASAVGIFAYIGLACVLVVRLDERTTLRLMALTLGVYVAAGFIGGVVAPDLAWMAPSVEETHQRLQGFSGHPNAFAQQIGICLTLLLVARRMRVMGRVAFLALGTTALMALLLTGSRTTLVAVAVAWFVVAAHDNRFAQAGAVVAAGAAILALYAAALGELNGILELFADFSRTGSASEIVTLTGRTDLWEVVRGLIGQRPLFGWGFNGTEALIQSSVDRNFYGDPVNAHNMYLQLLLSLGFLGSIPGFAFLAVLLLLMVLRPDPTRDQIAVYMLVTGMAEVELFSTPVLLTLTVFWSFAREAARAMNIALPADPASARA